MNTGAPIETGRSWRDLPPSPPRIAPPIPPHDAATAPVPPAEGVHWVRWTLAGLALLAGFAIGIWSPWSTPSTGGQTASSRLPDTIVPPPPSTTQPEPTLPGSGTEPGSGGGGLTVPFHGFEGLIRIPQPPAGYQSRGSTLDLSPRGLTESITLVGPAGDVTVSARLSPGSSSDAAGDPVEVRGTTGHITDDGDRLTLTWVDQGLVEVTIDAPSGVGRDWVIALAESLEVAG